MKPRGGGGGGGYSHFSSHVGSAKHLPFTAKKDQII